MNKILCLVLKSVMNRTVMPEASRNTVVKILDECINLMVQMEII